MGNQPSRCHRLSKVGPLLTLFLLGWVCLAAGCKQKPVVAIEPTAVPVSVALPIEKEIVDYEDFTGRTDAVESVDIRARVTGYLDKVCFQEGAEVKKGDLLFEIDPRPFQAQYDQASSQVKLCEADLKFRKSDLDRVKQLMAQNAVSGSDFDQSVASHDKAAAALATAQAAEEAARLNLDFTKLYSPIDGEISRARITKGNLVNADQTLLTSVVSVDPMYVYFDIDELTILRVQQGVRLGTIKVRVADEIPAWMGLGNEDGYPREGYLDFAENRLDPDTGTIQVRGVFPNPKPSVGSRVLRPGLFTRVRVFVGSPYKAILVPERALGADQGQKYLLVVNDKNEVEYRPVTVGKLDGQLRAIATGLKAGERVIVNGLQRVRPGTTVVPKIVDIDTPTK
jgi:membrane fusion protein, multidrug efflux system